MNAREYYVQCLAKEKPAFLRVFRAVPEDGLDYRPHERSMPAGEIVWMLVNELGAACAVIQKGEVDFTPSPRPSTVAEMVSTYEKNAAELDSCLPSLDDAMWERPTKFLMNGTVGWEAPAGEMLWGLLFDGIHHRGQLSAYLRPMGAKVPSIYGPSADDPGAH